jgi:large subunit ribosomal protein L47
MGRIKAVLNERRLAYEGAVKLMEETKDKEETAKVQQFLVNTQRKERKYLQRRRAYEARKQAKLAAEASNSTTPSESASTGAAAAASESL